MTERVVVITADNQVSTRDMEIIDGCMMKDLHDAVGGFFEIVQPMWLKAPYVLVCDDEGIRKHKPLNPIASLWYGSGMVGDVVVMKEGFRDGEPDILGLDEEEVQYIMDLAMEQVAVLA